MPTSRIKEQASAYRKVLQELEQQDLLEEKISVLDRQPEVQYFVAEHRSFREFLHEQEPAAVLAMKSVIVLGQGERLFVGESESYKEHLAATRDHLLFLENFFSTLGGVIGYHCLFLDLLKEIVQEDPKPKWTLERPPGLDLSLDSPAKRQAIAEGILNMGKLAELYPIGGAGERLGLVDEDSGVPLPAARLPFGGRTLLEGLVRDVQGREFLHHRLTGKVLHTPLAMMTSDEKDNHNKITAICEDKQWFHRPAETFKLFRQGAVPVLTEEGEWSTQEPLVLNVKPGGHGMIWKVAQDAGVFDWLRSHGRKKILVRQINNPASGVDDGLLAFSGVGLQGDKAFGYASCSRLLKSAEGIDVLLQENGKLCLSNIEYTDFQKAGIEDVPETDGSPFSKFPSNTNILFGDVDKIEEAIERQPLYGLVINLKSRVPFFNDEGERVELAGGRLESIMQNIGEYWQREKAEDLPTFLTYNLRRKTISAAKKAFRPGSGLNETPEGAFYTTLENCHELFTAFCAMEMPSMPSHRAFLEEGPSFLASYHPALGPLYEVIGQKVRGGSLAEGGELRLEIAELDMKDVDIEGSLLIHAEMPLGHLENGILQYSRNNGKCRLKNVQVKNKGFDKEKSASFAQDKVERRERLQISIEGSGEFHAENVIFEGDRSITVPDGWRMNAFMKDGEVVISRTKLSQPSWFWGYQMDKEKRIRLQALNSV